MPDQISLIALGAAVGGVAGKFTDKAWEASFLQKRLDNIVAVDALQIQWDHVLAGVVLTSVGAVVGGLAFDQITARRIGMPKWD